MKCFSFQKSYIAFLDILGFRDILKDKEKITLILETISANLDKIQDSKEDHKIYPDEDINSLMLSDSIILSISIDNADEITDRIKSLRYLLSTVEKLQYRLTLGNIWIRGGISEGELQHSDKNVVGEGLIKAMELEKKACYPRIIVDSRILYKLIKELYRFRNKSQEVDKLTILKEINQSYGAKQYSGKFLINWNEVKSTTPFFFDDFPFVVNYLNPVVENNSEDYRKIITHLRVKFSDSEPQIYLKYKWVFEYLKSITKDMNIDY